MLFEEYKSKILNDIESDNKINNNEYLELKKILNNKKIEITKKTEHIEDDYVDKDKANKNKKDDKGLEI